MTNKKTSSESSSLASLTSSKKDDAGSTSENGAAARRAFPAWILPVGLLVGFVLMLGLLFGKRLIPAVPVNVAPVITIRGAERAEVPGPGADIETNVGRVEQSLLFQASGWIEPDPFAISVSTLVSGIVEEVFVLEGETVTKGQVLAKLIDEDAVLELREKEARAATLESEIEAALSGIPQVEARRSGSVSSVASENSRLAELQDRLNRLSSLPPGSIPAIDLTAAELRVDQQKSLLQKAESDLPAIDSELRMIDANVAAKRAALREAKVAVEKAQLAFDRHTILSPMNGRVLLLHAAPGRKRLIQMDDPKSAYIVQLFDPAKLQARIDVPLSEAAALSVGQPVEMICDLLPDFLFKGEVTRITGEADLQRNTLQVKVEVKNPDDRLRPEMLVRGKFYPIPKVRDESGEIPPGFTGSGGRLSIYVPESALFNENQVWVVSPEETAELRTLTLAGRERENHQLITDGIHSGEMVILPPHDKLKPNAPIRILP